MDHIITSFDCRLLGDSIYTLHAKLPYSIDEPGCFVVFGCNGEIPFLFNPKQPTECSHNITSFNYKGDNYYYLYADKVCNSQTTSFNINNKVYCVSCCQFITITQNGEQILHKKVEDVIYSHYQQFKNHIILFFEGKRKFAVIIKDDKVLCADYYDEINTDDQELYLMLRLKDCLNHGRVNCITSSGFDSYLIYLDNYELNLKPQFMAPVFLDLLQAGNLKYCNQLLCADLQQEDCLNIAKFFPEFDCFLELEQNVFALIKNNTLGGVVKFEIDNLVTNISLL